uniref:(northern house mosquito) hypothetical protein n=1 Tax=Culex pipiens TaxID=7175 RepID=A0A8D8CHK5_CULPI
MSLRRAVPMMRSAQGGKLLRAKMRQVRRNRDATGSVIPTKAKRTRKTIRPRRCTCSRIWMPIRTLASIPRAMAAAAKSRMVMRAASGKRSAVRRRRNLSRSRTSPKKIDSRRMVASRMGPK